MLRLFHIVLVLGNRVKILKLPLYSIQFLHQITTAPLDDTHKIWLYSIQFLHQITTVDDGQYLADLLYSIQFLHQITTARGGLYAVRALYSIQFLHQITTEMRTNSSEFGCIVSNFYIKSQLRCARIVRNLVV